jgi:integrative and conjugative element protein (TIGR02256 family)
MDGSRPHVVTAFYSERAVDRMFQPEPGCSDPTFVGSTADVATLLCSALNSASGKLGITKTSVGIVFSVPSESNRQWTLETVELPSYIEVTAGNYRVRFGANVFSQAKSWVKQNGRRRSSANETGGLLWGLWDDAVQIIWIFGLSGPPPDSTHTPAHFMCGVVGTQEEHQQWVARSHGACGFVGHWHTHPDFPSEQSEIDIRTMATLVSSIGQNQKRSCMLIFGRSNQDSSACIYIYESEGLGAGRELISVGISQIHLKSPVL